MKLTHLDSLANRREIQMATIYKNYLKQVKFTVLPGLFGVVFGNMIV